MNRMKRYNIIKCLLVASVLLLVSYQTIELSRLILVAGKFYYPDHSTSLNFEVAYIFVTYVMAGLVLWFWDRINPPVDPF